MLGIADNDGALGEHGLASLRGRCRCARLGRLVDSHRPRLDDAERFRRPIALAIRILRRVQLFLWDRLAATRRMTRRAEQAIRLRRRSPQGLCGGNRTRHVCLPHTQQVLASVVRTARQRDLDLPALIATMLRATNPVVPEVLGLPPPPA